VARFVVWREQGGACREGGRAEARGLALGASGLLALSPSGGDVTAVVFAV
jgi:hypothetical protein